MEPTPGRVMVSGFLEPFLKQRHLTAVALTCVLFRLLRFFSNSLIHPRPINYRVTARIIDNPNSSLVFFECITRLVSILYLMLFQAVSFGALLAVAQSRAVISNNCNGTVHLWAIPQAPGHAFNLALAPGSSY
ncbi:hypothetical protein CC78DRAFT_328291 [Lojkania enalia]|uniref:Uncharacterized protein n=1 Tax=Lojkania enalia TaxID=147567 RepID=A0A9P4N139_9PLEO|nr:hypothetical protein CC78DRAFT_328291 [Didymosphaeria enalia]